MIRRTLAACALAALTITAPAAAGTIPVSTFAGNPAAGDSKRPALAPTGRFVAIDSTAAGLSPGDLVDGPGFDVFLTDLYGGSPTLISRGLEGAPADGDSWGAAVSAGARRIAFLSRATNLVRNDTNGQTDVFLESGDSIRRIPADGAMGEPNGPARDLDLSRNGHVIVFTSDATNLRPNDRNGASDVYAYDTARERLILVSSPDGFRGGNGPSRAPAVSPDGRWVSFYSTASNLVKGDRNGVGDVFLVDLRTRRVRLVSRSRSGKQQNAAVDAPFPQVSDVSGGGRYVAFDSDATNLVPADLNGATDVFVRNMRRGIVQRASVGGRSRPGNNDSFAPRISGDGRFVAFESFADNLVAWDPQREDVFVRDVRKRRTAMVGLRSDGTFRGPELVSQLLQRPSLTDDGKLVAFTTTSGWLIAGDDNGAQDVFVRTQPFG